MLSGEIWGCALCFLSFAQASLVTQTLQKVEVLIIEAEDCNGVYHNISSDKTIPKGYRFIYDDMICAGYSEVGKHACFVRIMNQSIIAMM